MTVQPKPGERYTIRRQVFKIFGAGFHIYDAEGEVCGYCKQKAFRVREDLRVYTDDSMTEELFRIGTRSVIDFCASYQLTLPTGEPMGAIRRKGMKSILRDSWLIFDPQENEIARIEEDSAHKALARRFLGDSAWLMPQTFHLRLLDGTEIATFRTHFNIFIHRLGVAVHQEHETIDDLVILGVGVLLGAIEGRQD